MTAIRFQIRQEILRICQEEISFDIDPMDEGTVNPIPPENMKLRKINTPRPMNEGFVAEEFPMLLISSPFKEDFPEDLGTNEEDQYNYRFMIQIVDSDNFTLTENLATYDLWQERVCRNFQFRDLTQGGNIQGASRTLATAAAVDVVDESQWLKDENFRTGIVILVRTWMTRMWCQT